jgi:hypothetical protein
MPLRMELSEEFDRVEREYRDAGEPLGPADFWVSSRRDGGVWTEHQSRNWREREFRPAVRQIASDFPQFRDIRNATPYSTRHSFISCCLQAGISLATIAAWCGTSIQMISETYGKMIRRYEGTSPVPLDQQFQTAKAEAMSLLMKPSPQIHEEASLNLSLGATQRAVSLGLIRPSARPHSSGATRPGRPPHARVQSKSGRSSRGLCL